jgi:hypothetical protein
VPSKGFGGLQFFLTDSSKRRSFMEPRNNTKQSKAREHGFQSPLADILEDVARQVVKNLKKEDYFQIPPTCQLEDSEPSVREEAEPN